MRVCVLSVCVGEHVYERAHKVVIMSGVVCANEMRDELAILFRVFVIGVRCLVFVECALSSTQSVCMSVWFCGFACSLLASARPKLD